MRIFHIRPFIAFILILFLLTGCGTSSGQKEEPPVYSPLQVLVPEAPGKKTLGASPLTLDISNADQGYLTAISDSDSQKMNVQLTSENEAVYSYFVSPGKSAVIPFSSGSGTYQICCYQQIDGSRYAALFADTLEVSLENEFLPFLYPNQYVNFTPDSASSKLALSIISEDASDVDALQAVYNYVVQNLTYDYDLADTVDSGYIPDVDSTLKSGKGICFDYAALMTAMLRSSGIPTRLDIGYATNIYHAWISTYLDEQGWVDNVIKFDGKNWTMMDPTFAAGGGDGIQDFITDSSNYNIEYIH